MERPVVIREVSACRVVVSVDQVCETLKYAAVEADGGIADHVEYRCLMCNRAVAVLIVDEVVELTQSMHYSAALFIGDHLLHPQLMDTGHDVFTHIDSTIPCVKLAFGALLTDIARVGTHRVLEIGRISANLDRVQVFV